MRSDAFGIFWQDEPKKKGGPVRDMPKIPKTGWKAPQPADWPNLKGAKILSIDTEAYDPNLKTHGPGWARGDSHLVGISVAVSRTEKWYFPMRHEIKPKQNLDPEKVLQWARDNLCHESLKIGANIQYDIGGLRAENVIVPGPYLDVQHAEALIDEHRLMYNLDSLAQQYLNEGKVSDKLYKWCARYYGGKINGSQRANIYRAPASLVGPYAEADAWQPYEIWKKQKKLVNKQGLRQVLHLECRLIPLLLDMRFRGVRIDLEYAEKLRDMLLVKQQKAQKALDEIAGTHVDVNSNDSIATAFKKNHLPYEKTEKGNPSFVKKWLNAHPHVVAKSIVAVRESEKLRSTFVENYLIDKSVNGRIHCEFRQLKGDEGGTVSGRLSSSKPNLQNIPVRSEDGALIRRAFIPDLGFEHWYRKDASQIEYRFLAHYAVGPGSKKLRRMYNKDPNTDFHRAIQILVKKITQLILERKPAKTINFGIVYGMGEPTLQATLGVAEDVAKKLFAAYHAGAPFVKCTFDHFAEIAQETGVIETLLGRKSRFNGYEQRWGKEIVYSFQEALQKWGARGMQRAHTHKALNRKLQGGAADHMKKGMVDAYEAGIFDALGGVPHLTVHDELDGSCNRHEHKEPLLALKHTLENCIKLRVPLLSDSEIGPNWGELEKHAD